LSYLCQPVWVKPGDILFVINLECDGKIKYRIMLTMEGGIYISDAAKTRVENLLQEEGRGPDYFVRVSVVSGGCSGLSYKMDFDNIQKPSDQVFTDKGMKIVTDFKSVLYLFNTTLDYSDGLEGKGFHFNNPNASRTCACGESFSV
jgi:iron-sulfur cluster assembly protein